MNVHHLELFYHVARHGGISRAVRHMPYGIQQPAVSGQLRALEKELGVRLFERVPFRLTPAGEKLRDFAAPFFDNLGAMAEVLRAEQSPVLRLGMAEVAIRDYVPAILARLRKEQPALRVKLRAGLQAEMEAWLEQGEVDLAIVPLGRRPPPRLRCRRLLRLPLVLLVPRVRNIRTAEELWRADLALCPLISMPSTESISRKFQQGLRTRGLRWPVSIEAHSLLMITQYTAANQGIGLSVAVPGLVRDRRVRVCPLDDFPSIEVAALWRDEPTPLIRAFLQEAENQLPGIRPGAGPLR
ncbi:MAG: LysR family transcriptional regulator [Opitutae bacterium]|nr:LysR family transcriptional regulator [Opitutae bacterium]